MKCKNYWKSCVDVVKDPKMFVIAALFIAIDIVIGGFFIPVGDNLRIYFTFMVSALGGAVYGPIMSIIAGFFGDIIGYVIHPSGAFFPGYTLSAVLSRLIFGLILFRKDITVLKLFISKLIINLFINVGLGSLWSAILGGKAYIVYMGPSIVKNMVLLPFEVIMLYLIFKATLPIINKANVINHKYNTKISLW